MVPILSYIYEYKIKMIQVQNIQQLKSIVRRAISIWSDSLCGDVVLGFTYNNEPKFQPIPLPPGV